MNNCQKYYVLLWLFHLQSTPTLTIFFHYVIWLKMTIHCAESFLFFINAKKRQSSFGKLFKVTTKNGFALKQTTIIVVLVRKPIYLTNHVGDDRFSSFRYQIPWNYSKVWAILKYSHSVLHFTYLDSW